MAAANGRGQTARANGPRGASRAGGKDPGLEVRAETLRGSGKRAARLDLESAHPLGDRTAFQDGLVAAYGEACSNEIERASGQRGELLEELADIDCELGWREADVDDANVRIDKAERKRDRIPASRLIQLMALRVYVALMALFSVAEYPLLKLSFTRLPVDDQTIRLVSVLVGVMFVATAHVLGLVAARVVQAEGERVESRRDWQLHRAVFVLGASFVLGAVVWLAMVRAGEIAAVGQAFGGLGVGHPAWLGAALGFLHALVLLAAFYLAYQRARGAEARAIESEIAEIKDERAKAETALEALERRRERLLVHLDTLDEQGDQRLERLLRHHQHEEADYLAVLRRVLQSPPSEISDWDDDFPVGRAHRRRTRTTASANGRLAKNGSPSRTTAARRVKRALRDHDSKEETP